MTIDPIEEARKEYEQAVAGAIGIDPTASASLEVDLRRGEVSWSHIGTSPYPPRARLHDEQECGKPIRLSQRQFTIGEWEAIRRAEQKWRANFPAIGNEVGWAIYGTMSGPTRYGHHEGEATHGEPCVATVTWNPATGVIRLTSASGNVRWRAAACTVGEARAEIDWRVPKIWAALWADMKGA